MRNPIDNYFLEVANLVGSRGTCDRGKAGAIIVRDNQILSAGYVGAPSGLPHCDDEDHDLVDNSCVRTVHAEMNAICQAAKNGISINNSIIYSTMFPCYNCAKIIINAGVIKVIADYDYHKSQRSKEIFDFSGIKYEIIHDSVKKYGKL